MTEELSTHIYIYIHICLGLPRWLSGKKIHQLMQEMQIGSLGKEDPLEEEMATHSSTLSWEIP